MSESALNGNHGHNQPPAENPDDSLRNSPIVKLENDTSVDAPAFNVVIEGGLEEGPPLKKRKVTDDGSHKSSPRPSSPPWKKITADGPTTFIDNGRRRSGRTNVVPLEQQPHSGKRQTRAAYDKLADRRSRRSCDTSVKSSASTSMVQRLATTEMPVRRGPGRPPKVKGQEASKRIVEPGSPHLNRRTSTRVAQQRSPIALKNDASQLTRSIEELSKQKHRPSSPPLILQKVKFRVALPQPSVLTPLNAPAPKKYGSFREFLEIDPLEPFAGQDLLTAEQIKKEASSRIKVHAVHRPGRLVDSDNVNSIRDKRVEPPKQFAHQDHLIGHISHFRNLLWQERKDHRKKAEQLAHEAKRRVEEKKRLGRVKTTEELIQEQLENTRARYRRVVKDMDRLWLAVVTEVNVIRQRRLDEERQAKIKSHLNRVLERTDEMLTRREESEATSDVDSDADETISHTEDEDDESDSEVMSTSSSDTGSRHSNEDPDEGLTAEQLRLKYESLADLETGENTEGLNLNSNVVQSEADDSDPDVEMDSEFDSSDSSHSNKDNVADVESDDENGGGGLLSLFFSEKEVNSMKLDDMERFDVSTSNGLAESIESGDMKHGNDSTLEEHTDKDIPNSCSATRLLGQELIAEKIDAFSYNTMIKEVSDTMDTDQEPLGMVDAPEARSLGHGNVLEEHTSQDPSVQTSPDTSATKQSELDSVSSLEPQTTKLTPALTIDEKTSIKTTIPSLLRGTLREYQHEGLDWLANLYANGRSGILADEMGLGKTIQSIALLAHLATEYEIWGPHLIVVPTSVILNWEMEFKKFLPGFKILTYYGTLEERKQKRRGWMADDSFNVCITSYQLVLQDANSFKRRRWHYMILDEAHNIKNFRSERWQTMMTFNTRARLLLTGTPLQNNLTELWSLLFFLHYGQEGEDDDEAFAGLKEWSEWFKRPVESILEHGRQVLDQEDKEQVAKLHKVIRPFLLRRLKADVEKQMPAKYEHVEMCRLSKRQRQLYDGFMSRTQTKETLASGNYLSIINALMQLRKVCNHPDLFETRPINTSFAMPKSVAAEFQIKNLLLRRKLLSEDPLDEIDLDFLQLVPISNERISLTEYMETVRRHAYQPFKGLRDRQSARVNRHAISAGQGKAHILASLENVGRRIRLQDIDRTMYYEAYRHHQRPIYGRSLLNMLEIRTKHMWMSRSSGQHVLAKSWDVDLSATTIDLMKSSERRSHEMQPIIEQYACTTSAVVATDLSTTFVTETGAKTIIQELGPHFDPFHQARMKLSIAFPDKRLLQYDCGKLQRLEKLLRQLQAGGHRALIFTQMTKVLDILEQFLNIHGHRYLRLDGATKIEQRQILTDRFNNDTRILCFILSSRSGGLGINLTGADTVIFYDLDWNPAMDRQCTDRAHRIGQTRDVHIYRFVSEHTIESNILRKANQKQMLDDVVIQEGDFTTDYMNKLTYRDMLDEHSENDVAGAAMDRLLGNGNNAVTVFEQAEDQEDVSAAKVAAKEVQHADHGDFEDNNTATPQTGEPGTPGFLDPTVTAITEVDNDGIRHIDEYMMKLQTFLLKDVPMILPKDKRRKGRKRGDGHRKIRPR